MLVILAAAAGIAIANPHPHVIRDAQDAVATACAEWVSRETVPGVGLQMPNLTESESRAL
jgi:hypothetical protein